MTYYAAPGRIGTSPIDGGVEITREQYKVAIAAMMGGKVVEIVDGALALVDPPQPEPASEPEPHE